MYYNLEAELARKHITKTELAKQLGVQPTKWHNEDEILYQDTARCLELLSSKFKIGIIANQELGTKKTRPKKQYSALIFPLYRQ